MYLQSLTFTNVRQFAQRTFKFQPGFNLLVGENGAGKTTVLRGLLAVLGGARQMGRRPRLDDNDIRLRARLAEIRAEIRLSDGRINEFIFRKSLWKTGSRSANPGKPPLILLYSSNEAICSAMKMKPTKSIQNIDNNSFRRSEKFLYESERRFFLETTVDNATRFGNSHLVRRFVNKVLATFSSDMKDFYWAFEPYDCSLIPIESTAEKSLLDADLQKQARAFAMRWFEEELERRFAWPDKAKIILMPKRLVKKRDAKDLPYADDIWAGMDIPPSVRKLLLSYSLEVKLTPRIMLHREIGTLSVSQLSDGEQRLFSLFVDIARQLSITNSNSGIGEGEAIILIDEIDVHLHPKWQRQIVPALEDLFPSCQFIATTHSPFVIQATRREQITSIGSGHPTMYGDGGNSIEDIVEDIQGVSVPQRSIRAENLSAAAKQYFTLLERRAANAQEVDLAELRAAEWSYREASEPFTSDSAVHALLKILASGGKDQ